MKTNKIKWIVAIIGLAILASSATGYAKDKKKKDDNSDDAGKQTTKQTHPASPGNTGGGTPGSTRTHQVKPPEEGSSNTGSDNGFHPGSRGATDQDSGRKNQPKDDKQNKDQASDTTTHQPQTGGEPDNGAQARHGSNGGGKNSPGQPGDVSNTTRAVTGIMEPDKSHAPNVPKGGTDHGLGGNVDHNTITGSSDKSPGANPPGRITGGPIVHSPPSLHVVKGPDGKIGRVSPSGVVREIAQSKPDGEHTQHINVSGRKVSEEIQKPDGTKQTVHYDPAGRVRSQESVNKDGTSEVSHQQFGRGTYARTERVQYDDQHNAMSRTVERNSSFSKTVIINHYDHGRYGFVYRPVYVVHSPVFVSWYDPYWYSPAGMVVYHPYNYAWGWENYGWYNTYHGAYWTPCAVYPAPSYWVGDYMVAGYLADHYDAQPTIDQLQEEVRLAREDAAKANQVALNAQEDAEIAEAKTAQSQAELRATKAENRLATLQNQTALAGKPNSKATPIDKATMETWNKQIENTIAEKKAFAEQSDKGGNPPPPDVAIALQDPKHIYAVCKVVSVSSAKDLSQAGSLSEGDLLKLEPGQDDTLTNLSDTTIVKMRVMTSKGEEGEVTAGTTVNVAIKDLQEFDNEFLAKLDAGLAEADKNKDLFRQGVVTQ